MMWFLLTTLTSRKWIFCILDTHKHYYGCKLCPLQMPELSILLCRDGGWGFADPMNPHPTSWHYKAKWNTAKKQKLWGRRWQSGKAGKMPTHIKAVYEAQSQNLRNTKHRGSGIRSSCHCGFQEFIGACVGEGMRAQLKHKGFQKDISSMKTEKVA